jgi:hypothetical protein
MSESGLSVGYADLCAEIGRFLGYGSTSTNWSASQLAEIDSYCQSGVRRVYYPPAISGLPQDMLGYEWSWLRPTTTLAVTSGTADYDLPDDLGRVVGCFYYPTDEYKQSIQQVSVGRLLSLRASGDESGYPYCFATRFKTEDRTAGSRQEVLFYPEPDDSWTLNYEYEAYSGTLSGSYPYPLGGMKLAELYIESCLSVAESRANEESGIHTANFQSLLVDAIQRDRKRGAVQYGQMGDMSDNSAAEFHRGDTGASYQILYKGVSI